MKMKPSLQMGDIIKEGNLKAYVYTDGRIIMSDFKYGKPALNTDDSWVL